MQTGLLDVNQLEKDIEAFANPINDRYEPAPTFRSDYLALAASPDYRRLAEIFLRAGYEEEEKRFTEMAGFQVALGYCGRAKALANVGKFMEAQQVVRQAVAIDPQCREAHLLLGGLHLSLADQNVNRNENWRNATRAFEAALVIDSANVDARLGLADIAQKQGNLDDAIRIIQSAIEKNLHHSSVLNQRYQLYWIKGRLEFEKGDNLSASKSLSEAYDLRPVEPGLATDLGVGLCRFRRI